MRALFIGRFQPFHNGHLDDLRKIAKQFDDVVIVIGSKQQSRTKENPFSYEERKEMINAVLTADNIHNVNIVGVDDINCNENYVRHVEKQIPKCDAVFSGNELIQNLFKEKGYEVKELPRLWELSSTKIREAIHSGEKWQHMVPVPVLDYLRSIDAEEIIQKLPES